MSNTMNKVEFGIWVRQEREKLGWSQADLAKASGLYRSLINNIESGKSRSTPETLTALANALNYPPSLLFELADYLPRQLDLSIIKRKLVHLAEELPDSDIESVIALLEQRQEYYKKNPQAKPSK